MTLAELGSLGEFLSSLGVMATMIFLIIEVRRNTDATRSTDLQRTFDRFSSARNMLTSNNDLASSVVKMEQGEALTLSERRQVEEYLDEYGISVLYYRALPSGTEVLRKSQEDTLNNFVRLVSNDIGREYLAHRKTLPDAFRQEVIAKLESKEIRSDA